MGARRLGRIHQIRETGSNTPKWGLPGKSKLFQRCNVKEDMFFSLTEKQVQLKKKIYCLKTKFCRHTEQRKQIKARWLTSLYFSYFNRDFFQQFSTEISDSIFSHVRTSSRVSLVEMVTTLCVKLQRTSVFFTLKSYHINVFNMDFTKIQVQSYVIPWPEKGKILKQSCVSAISYLFCSRQLCKCSPTSQRK